MWSRTEGSAATTALQDFEGLKSYYRVSTIVPGSDGGVKSVPGSGGSVIDPALVRAGRRDGEGLEMVEGDGI